MSQKGLQMLTKENEITFGKQLRVSFSKNLSHRKSHILELIHTDVCGPMKVKTFGGAIYFATFIDNCFRKAWAYALRRKDHVADVFREFHANVEKEIGRSLNCIQLDNGGEYNGLFDEYCKSQGIRH